MNDFQAFNRLLSLPNFAVRNYDAIMLCGTEMVAHFESKLGLVPASAPTPTPAAISLASSTSIVLSASLDKSLLTLSVADRENIAPIRSSSSNKPAPPPPATSHKSVYGNVATLRNSFDGNSSSISSSSSSSSSSSNSSNGGGGGSNINTGGSGIVSLTNEEMIPLLSALRAVLPPEMEVIFCKLLKMILRSQDNRNRLGKYGILTIICVLKRQKEQKGLSCGEICSTLLNTCYEPSNVKMFIDEGGLGPILQLLHSVRDTSILVKILGALQGICHVPTGRQRMLGEMESMRRVVALMRSEDSVVRARASGVIHNISIDTQSIHVIRDLNVIQVSIELLKDFSVEVCQAVAGTIQNMSRETFSRALILEQEQVVIQNLFDLVVSNDVNCQVASMGALLNLLSPTLDEEGKIKLREILSNGVVLGALKSSIFE